MVDREQFTPGALDNTEIHPQNLGLIHYTKYIPAPQESVVGLIIGRSGAEGWRVDIGASHVANLDALAFEGATKRNRPNLKVSGFYFFFPSLQISHIEEDPRSDLWFMRAFLWHIKIWSLN